MAAQPAGTLGMMPPRRGMILSYPEQDIRASKPHRSYRDGEEVTLNLTKCQQGMPIKIMFSVTLP